MNKVAAIIITPVLAISLFGAYRIRSDNGTSGITDTPGQIEASRILKEREKNGYYAAVEWPNNWQTQQIPEPPFEVVGENTLIEDVGEGSYEKACRITFTDVSNEEIKVFVKKHVITSGFIGKISKDTGASYCWQGKNTNKVSIEIEWQKDGQLFITFFQN